MKKPKIISIKERKFEEREPPNAKTHKMVHSYKPAR